MQIAKVAVAEVERSCETHKVKLVVSGFCEMCMLCWADAMARKGGKEAESARKARELFGKIDQAAA
jgi:hypothetical protein